ncbi:MAG: hypothetical protein HY074_07475, partial [Deltaproteobacteria bacterium]|nr:hypothetical protein [Deltaproteobacteria bacterium]
LRLSRKTHEGVALGIGLAPFAADIDPKVAAELALDEALRNAAVAGMDPAHAALVDNFCWPDSVPGKGNPQDEAEKKLGALVVTCRRIYEGAVELRMPFVSGKDSMKNDYRMGDVKISVPPTLLITALGKVHDVRRVPRGHAVAGGASRRILWVSGQDVIPSALGLPKVDFRRSYEFLGMFHQLIRAGLIESAHDVSDGGWLTTTAEMLLGTGVGAEVDFQLGDFRAGEPGWAALFGEPATSFVLLVREEDVVEVTAQLSEFMVLDVGRTRSMHVVGESGAQPCLDVKVRGGPEVMTGNWSLAELDSAYHGQGVGAQS